MNETQALLSQADVSATSVFRVEVTTRLPEGAVHRTDHPQQLFFLEGALTPADVLTLCRTLLADPVTDTFTAAQIDPHGQIIQLITDNPAAAHAPAVLEVTLLPGVTDPTAENLVRAAQVIGMVGLKRAATGQRYSFDQAMTQAELEHLAFDRYANTVIQRAAVNAPIAPPFVPTQAVDASYEVIPVRAADDAGLLGISAERRLALNLPEMQAVRAYFAAEDRDPTDLELEMLAQTWSEHCVHKTFKAVIDYTGPDHGAPATSAPVQQQVNGLLKTYLRAATDQVAKPWVLSAFVDNAGIIAFDDTLDLAFKVETHNHPSALEPFGGANTGVGGVVRDVLGVSAKPIANTDVLCFGPPDTPLDQLPDGVLPPTRIAEGVVHGVEDYGNKMGIPTVNGAILYHPGYTANPLVFCGCLGSLPHGSHVTGAHPGDLIVVIGGRTGRDGLRGATFSSMEMDTTTTLVSGSAVQIGHPIQEKQVQEVILRLRDAGLYHAITDCGAGGLSSAVGEMAAELGGVVQLETVPLKYPGLRPWEIWLSEAQERMVLAISPEHWQATLAICAGQDVEAAAIGTFEATGRLVIRYEQTTVGDLSVNFLQDGIPQRHLTAEWTAAEPTALTPVTSDAGADLLGLLALPNIRSKEDVIRRYDHEVQGATALKPLVGVDNHGPSDAAVLVPKPDSTRAVALSAGICPAYGEIDPYAMAWAAIDEAFRNLTAAGADPDQVAILDNFCWGNPNLPDRLGSLVRCSQGCYDAAIAFSTPYISGKDSLNNEYADTDGQRHAIPGTLLISAVGIVPDVRQTVSMDWKAAGNRLFLIGATRAELGGSHYAMLHGLTGGSVPAHNPDALTTLRALHGAMQAGLVRACHDCSEGGLAVTLAEMSLAGRIGAQIDLTALAETSGLTDAAELLFSESLTRFVVEVTPENADAFEAQFAGLPLVSIGLTGGDTLTVTHGDPLFALPVAELETAWRGQSAPVEIPARPAFAETQRPVRAAVRTAAPRALILHANGSNRDHDAALACKLAGADPEIVHINQLIGGERDLLDYHMLIVPGGFSYGDDLGAGKLWALNLRETLGPAVTRFVEDGRPVMGICNGFQTLVKAGLLPGFEWRQDDANTVTLTRNLQGHFECRWVTLTPNPNSPSLFTDGLTEPIACPVAHGEGRIATLNQTTLDALWSNGLAALTYTDANGGAVGYPGNPNQSPYGIAGVCNAAGNVLGLMPHPENHVFPWQHPNWRRGEIGRDGLRLFQNAVRFA